MRASSHESSCATEAYIEQKQPNYHKRSFSTCLATGQSKVSVINEKSMASSNLMAMNQQMNVVSQADRTFADARSSTIPATNLYQNVDDREHEQLNQLRLVHHDRAQSSITAAQYCTTRSSGYYPKEEYEINQDDLFDNFEEFYHVLIPTCNKTSLGVINQSPIKVRKSLDFDTAGDCSRDMRSENLRREPLQYDLYSKTECFFGVRFRCSDYNKRRNNCKEPTAPRCSRRS